MKLTVGPLPAAVYWRRRAAVLGGVLVLGVLMFYSCGGSDSDANPASGDGKRKTSPTPSIYPTEDPSEQPPDNGGDPDPPEDSADPSTDGGPGSGSGADVPDCADGDLGIRPEPAHSQTPVGARLRINLVITNVSDRACRADIGADRQEVRLMNDKQRIWSSDDCKPQRGTQVEVLSPGVPVERFWVTWDGKSSAPKCEGNRHVVQEGSYSVVARLGEVTSKPVSLKVVDAS